MDIASFKSGGFGLRFFRGKSSSSLSSLISTTTSLELETVWEEEPGVFRFKLGKPVLDSLLSLRGIISTTKLIYYISFYNKLNEKKNDYHYRQV